MPGSIGSPEPAVSVPCGRGAHGLPVGLQLIAPHFEESRLLVAAQGVESLLGAFPAPDL